MSNEFRVAKFSGPPYDLPGLADELILEQKK